MAKFIAKSATCLLIVLLVGSIFVAGHIQAQSVPRSITGTGELDEIYRTDNLTSENNVVKIIGIDLTTYPKIKVNILVDKFCVATGDLNKEELIVEEDGNEVAIDNFYFTGRASGQKLDLAVVFDETDTMADEIDAMQSKVDDLTNKIKSSNIDARYSLVTFKTEVLPKIEWTDDADVFKREVDLLRASGGNYQRPEDSLGCVAKALSFGFRSDAQKIIIVITDEPSMQRGDGWSNSTYYKDDVQQDLINAGVMLVAVSPDFRVGTIPSNIPRSDLPLYADMSDLAQNSGGLWIDIYSADFSVILDQLEEIITGTYVIEYASPVTTTGDRAVTVTVNAPDCVQGGASSSYAAPASPTLPNEPPVIIDLTSDKTSPQEARSVVTWAVEAEDPDGDQVLYRFFLDDEPMTDWTTENIWTWVASETGSYRIKAQVRDGKHTGSSGMDDGKLVRFDITGPNTPPIINALTSDKTGPQELGTNIVWIVNATDAEYDDLQYRFSLDGVIFQDWSKKSAWVWSTSDSDAGSHNITAAVRDGNHDPNWDDYRSTVIELTSINSPPVIRALTSDKMSPQEGGSVISWTVKAEDPDGDKLLYRFFLNDVPTTNWAAENAWTWTAPDDAGTYQIEVQVRDGMHAGPGGTDDQKLVSFNITGPDETEVVFLDPNLKAAVRTAINKPDSSIYASDLEQIDRLEAGGRDIKDITGLEYCSNLQYLDLGSNKITEISPLASLSNLQYLNLVENRITEVSTLAGITNLQYLNLVDNQITNVSPLASLTNLQHLYLVGNKITDEDFD